MNPTLEIRAPRLTLSGQVVEIPPCEREFYVSSLFYPDEPLPNGSGRISFVNAEFKRYCWPVKVRVTEERIFLRQSILRISSVDPEILRFLADISAVVSFHEIYSLLSVSPRGSSSALITEPSARTDPKNLFYAYGQDPDRENRPILLAIAVFVNQMDGGVESLRPRNK